MVLHDKFLVYMINLPDKFLLKFVKVKIKAYGKLRQMSELLSKVEQYAKATNC